MGLLRLLKDHSLLDCVFRKELVICMIQSCRRCKNYKISDKYCYIFHMNIIDTISASVCQSYDCKTYVPDKVRCVSCSNMNKYGYCLIKKVCFDEDERLRYRKCSRFKKRLKRKKKKKY